MLNLRKILLGVIILAAFVILGCAEVQPNHDNGAASAANTGHHGMSH